MTENEQNAFDEITAGVEIKFEYKTLEISENAPEPIAQNRRNRQWALVDDQNQIVALGPASGGMKSAFIAEAAKHEGWKAAHRWITAEEWKVPQD